ncbi:hypothetical protein HJFPF1_03026 [Paramyrothecium foliicola]|nr:hypothetical protein HJFPF1_03026 [Paramyrothecium foliicola]
MSSAWELAVEEMREHLPRYRLAPSLSPTILVFTVDQQGDKVLEEVPSEAGVSEMRMAHDFESTPPVEGVRKIWALAQQTRPR